MACRSAPEQKLPLGAGEDDRADVVVGARLDHGVVHADEHRSGERVVALRPVHGDDHRVAVAFDECVGHRTCSPLRQVLRVRGRAYSATQIHACMRKQLFPEVPGGPPCAHRSVTVSASSCRSSPSPTAATSSPRSARPVATACSARSPTPPTSSRSSSAGSTSTSTACPTASTSPCPPSTWARAAARRRASPTSTR